ncbi:alpha/beta hydrolase fold domain-containing protein [Heyndrickxia sporothermodurans]
MKKGKIQLKPRLLSFNVFCILILGTAFYYFQHASGQEVKESNLKYGNNPKQTLDIYTPKNQNGENLPVIIYAHGGGWRGGDKKSVSDKPNFFTENGYAFISINYRLSPEASYREMANDVSNAIKWVYDNADNYHFDRTKINLIGHSAGAHLILLVVTNPHYLSNVGLSYKLINSVVGIEGPLDLTDFIKRFGTYKKVFGNDQKVWEKASPITYASNKDLPPTLLIDHGNNGIGKFLDTTKKSGNKVASFKARTLSHSELTELLGTSKNEEATNMTNAVIKFLEKYN